MKLSQFLVRLKVALAFLVTFGVGISLVLQVERNERLDRQRAAADIAVIHAHLLQERVDRALSATYALAAVLRQGKGEIDRFDELAAEMLRLYGGVSALQLAPNGVISRIVPLAGNEKALGHNLLEDPKRNKEAIAAIQTRKLTLAGPFNLLQGGLAVVGRLPVFMADEHGRDRFWGFTTALIRIPDLLEASKLDPISEEDYHYELSRIHPDTGKRDVFARSSAAPLQDPVSYVVRVPSSDWTLSLAPRRGWHSPPALLAAGAAAVLLVSFLVALFTWNVLQQPLVLRREVEARTRALSESTQKYRFLADSIPQYIWTATPDGGQDFANARWYEFTGLSTDAPLDPYAWHRLCHPDDLDRAVGTWSKAVTSGQPYSCEYRLRGHDGEYRWVLSRALPQRDAVGNVMQWFGSGTDITELKQLEAALRESEQRLTLAMRGSDTGVWEFDLRRDRVEVDAIFMAVLGYGPDEVRTVADWKALLHEEDAARVRQSMGDLIDGRATVQRCELRVRTRNGLWRWLLSQAVVADRDSSGRAVRLVGTHTDIDRRKRVENELQERERKLSSILNNSPAVIYMKDPAGRYELVNPNFERVVRLPASDIVGKDDVQLFPAHTARALRENDLRVIASKVRQSAEELMPVDGEIRTYMSYKFPILDETGGVRSLCGISIDITEAKRSEEQLRLAAKALENAAEGVIITRRGIVLSVNRAFCAITGYTSAEVVGTHASLLQADARDQRHWPERREEVAATGTWQGEVAGRRKSGEVYPAWLRLSAVEDEVQGRYYVTVFSDISQAKEAEARLEFLAHHDALTQLPNRTLMQERLGEMLLRAQRHDAVVAVLYIDLDHFKPVNDSLGHAVGDELLQNVAQRLSANVRKTDLVARIGGDEFVVLLEELRGPDEVSWIAQNVVEVLARPFVLAGQQIYISASIGVACYPQDGKTAETLMRHADNAMYEAKKEGKNAYHFFSPGMDKRARERLFLMAGLRKALERDELALVYQPRISASTGEVLGVEALVRWHSPEHGLILPNRFIGLAEETGIIEPIGEWVLKTACAQLMSWKASGLAPGFVSVNLSARQFRQPKLVERVAAILAETGAESRWLELEITESVVMANPEKAKRVLSMLAGLGVCLSLDDFGTGHSSLAYLQRFPVHHLKIDQSFVRELPENRESANITKAIVAMAKSLELEVTAEGVETEAQRQFLADAGCDAWQGFLFTEALGAAELGAFLASCGKPDALTPT